MRIMDICQEILINVVDRWNEKYNFALTKEFIDLLDVAIRMAHTKTHTELKEKLMSQVQITADQKTNRYTVNLGTLKFIIQKL